MQNPPLQELPPGLVETLLSASSVTVLTGAGMSAESGIPTFRDALTGLWSKFRPEELATPDAFRRNPTLVWEWYEFRRAGVLAAEPHTGHLALAELERHVKNLTVVTQNVDGLHQRAGSGKVLELHGNILRSVCSETGREIDMDWLRQAQDLPPRSPWSGTALARPAVVWFGEPLPAETFEQALEATQHCDLLLAIGTSGVVEPAASLPRLAAQNGAMVVEINPEATPLSPYARHCIRAGAGPVLTQIIERITALANA